MHIVIGAVLVIVLLGVYLYIADKRKKEQRAREEQLRREKIINRLNDISREMINDNRFQSLFQHLDGIMTPQEHLIDSIGIYPATIKIRLRKSSTNKWSVDESKVLEVSTLPYAISVTGENDMISLAYAILQRYPFLCYRFRSSISGEGVVKTRDLSKVYFDAFDDCSHYEPRCLSNLGLDYVI